MRRRRSSSETILVTIRIVAGDEMLSARTFASLLGTVRVAINAWWQSGQGGILRSRTLAMEESWQRNEILVRAR